MNKEELVALLREARRHVVASEMDCTSCADVLASDEPEGCCMKFMARLDSAIASISAGEDEAKDAERLDWLEQFRWESESQCHQVVGEWRDLSGKRHPEGLRAAIDAIKESKS